MSREGGKRWILETHFAPNTATWDVHSSAWAGAGIGAGCVSKTFFVTKIILYLTEGSTSMDLINLAVAVLLEEQDCTNKNSLVGFSELTQLRSSEARDRPAGMLLYISSCFFSTKFFRALARWYRKVACLRRWNWGWKQNKTPLILCY